MTALLLRLLSKACGYVPSPFAPGRDYIRPQRGDGARDALKLTDDMRNAGIDLRILAEREIIKDHRR